MCIILDANRYSAFLDPTNEDMKPVRDWIRNKNGKIAWSRTEKLEQELEDYPKMRKQFDQYREIGILKIYKPEDIKTKRENLPNLKSDDPDIIALAQVSGVALLISNDKRLHADFKEIIKGKIYQTKQHKDLLKKDLCP